MAVLSSQERAIMASSFAMVPVSTSLKSSRGAMAVAPSLFSLPSSSCFLRVSLSTRESYLFSQQQKRRSSFIVRAEDGGAPVADPPAPLKPSMAKGSIVSVDKEKYLASVEFKAVDHPPYFKGLDYIYQARGEVLDARIFESGEYALVAWSGIPTAPAWLPVYMLTKEKLLSYKRT